MGSTALVPPVELLGWQLSPLESVRQVGVVPDVL